MGDHLWPGIQSPHLTSQLGQLSFASLQGHYIYHDVHISQGSVATYLRCGWMFNMNLLQIYQWVCQWKNGENQLTFWEVIGRGLVSSFFDSRCRVPASAGVKSGNVSSVRWQVTLCDLIWHVSSCNDEANGKLLCSVYVCLYYMSLRKWKQTCERLWCVDSGSMKYTCGGSTITPL